MHCEITGLPGAEKHHILTRKTWLAAAEIPENIIYLHPDLHTRGGEAVHTLGIWSFAERFGLTERFKRAQEAVWAASSAGSKRVSSVT